MNTIQQGWDIGLSSWIVQDGNYDDFETGQVVDFALELYSKAIRADETKQKSAKDLGRAMYSITGEIIYLTPDVWVLDFGIRAFQESKPPEGFVVGSFVAAEIYLGIDPFFYFEYLHRRPNIPALIYSWNINSVRQQTAPFVETRDPSGRKMLIRDETKHGFKAIKKTDAWTDDGGNAEYVLSCVQLDAPPKFRISKP